MIASIGKNIQQAWRAAGDIYRRITPQKIQDNLSLYGIVLADVTAPRLRNAGNYVLSANAFYVGASAGGLKYAIAGAALMAAVIYPAIIYYDSMSSFHRKLKEKTSRPTSPAPC